MKKLYLFGDSFSMLTMDLKTSFKKYLEVNAHYSISNEHILKLAKLKLLKLVKNKIRGGNFLIQLTIPNRMLVLNGDNIKNALSQPDNLLYDYKHLISADLEIFEQEMYATLYPFSSIYSDFAIKNLFVPYMTLIIDKNYKKIIKDLEMEIQLLIELGNSYDINVEYFYYTNDFDGYLRKKDSGSHIKFGEFHSMENFLRNNFENSYFFSKLDKHLNYQGMLWYMDFLKKRYDF